MSIRSGVLGLMLALALPLGGCGDDGDSDGDGGGGGNSGGGGTSGTSGAGTSGAMGSGLTAEEARAGLCGMTEDSGSDSLCAEISGIEEYTACADQMCDLDECISGPCASLTACQDTAEDPCTCMADSACTNCFIDKASCTLGCFDRILCDGQPITEVIGGGASGSGGEGGASGMGGAGSCDALDACCASLPDAQKSQCMMAAGFAEVGGDSVCEPLLTAYCPD